MQTKKSQNGNFLNRKIVVKLEGYILIDSNFGSWLTEGGGGGEGCVAQHSFAWGATPNITVSRWGGGG